MRKAFLIVASSAAVLEIFYAIVMICDALLFEHIIWAYAIVSVAAVVLGLVLGKLLTLIVNERQPR